MIGGRTNSSSTPQASCNDLEYGTDGTSGGSDIENESKSPSDVLSDDETSEDKAGCPTELHRAHANEIDDMKDTDIYAESTKRQLNSVSSHWRQFCKHKGYNDPKKKIQKISSDTISDFFSWRLVQMEGKRGRKLRGTKSASSLDTYRKLFLRVYRMFTGKDMDSVMSRKVLRVTQSLAKEHCLSYQPREKPSMDVEDVLEIIRTTLTTTEKMFQIGRYRIQACFFMQGGFITANRPQALLGLRYKDVKVTVLRNPNGGPHNILIELTYNSTKSYLGPKPSNTFKIPEIIFDPYLCMNPHVFLLGLMFADKVFSNPNLTPEDLFKLDIRPECNELVVPIKEAVADLWVFRRYDKTATGRIISDEALPYSTIKEHMKDVGEIAGFKEVTRPYCLRYGSGNAFDKDPKTSENMRNMIMNHSTSKVFLNHYASRNIQLDTQAVVRGTMPQEGLIQAASRMSRSIDPHRPRYLTDDQKQSIERNPEIQKLLKERDQLDKSSPEHKELVEKIRKKRQQEKFALRKRIRREYDNKRAAEDIQRQLSGEKFEESIKDNLRQCPQRTQQHKALIESLLTLPGSSLEKERERRVKAIDAIAKYCHHEEGQSAKTRSRGLCADHDAKETVEMSKSVLEKAMDVFGEEKRPTVCFVCLGNEDLAVEKRVYRFSTPGDLTKHFVQRHLKKFNEGTGEECRLCNEHFSTRKHMQRHAFELHGTVSNSF